MYEVNDIACIYSITNVESEKMYIGNTKDLRTRLASHIYEFKGGTALEAYFLILYNSLESGYNMAYTYQDKQHAIRAIRQNIEYITRCLHKNGLSQSTMIFEDVVEINL